MRLSINKLIHDESAIVYRRILLLLGAGFLFRLIFSLYFHTIITPDSGQYKDLAENLLAGKFYSDLSDTIRQPGYPIFLALPLSISGNRVIAAVGLQQVLGAFTAVLTYLTARKFFQEKTALFAGWLVAVNPALAYFGDIIGMEVLLIFLGILALYLTINALMKNRWDLFIASGLVLGYMMGTKSISILLTLSVCVVILKCSKPHPLVKTLIVILPTLVVFFIWSTFNFVKFGYFSFAPSYGLNLLERSIYLDSPHVSDPIKTQVNKNYSYLKDQQALGAQSDQLYWSLAVINTFRDYRSQNDLVKSNQNFFQLAIRQIGADPLGYVRTTFVELAYTWAGYTPNWAKSRPTGPTELSDWSFLVLGVCLGVVMVVLVGFSIIQNLRKANWVSLLWIMPVLLIPLATAMIIPSDYRYRLIVEPFILTLMADGIYQFRNREIARMNPA